MRTLFFVSMIYLGCCLALTGCDAPRDNTGTTTGITDSDLEKSVDAKLDSDSKVKDADLSVDADAARNEVRLSGTVDSSETRNRAIELARSAKPGINVIDKITVKTREVSRSDYTEEKARAARDTAKRYGDQIGETIDDAWIHTKIVAKLIGDPDTPQRKINVDVVNNEVTLRGSVDTPEQKAEAERITRETDGVKSVKNLLKVVKASAAKKS